VRVRNALRYLALAVPPCFAAVYPLALSIQSHDTTHLFSPQTILRPATVLVVVALGVFAVLRMVLGESNRASVTATLFFVLTGLFPVLFNVRGEYQHFLVSVTFTAVAMGLAVIGGRVLVGSAGLVLSWAVTVIVVWTLGAALFVSRAVWPAPPWRGTVERMIAAGRSAQIPAHAATPDIYYIVLDGMARIDVLERLFAVKGRAAVAALEARGVQVPRFSRSNYSQTQLSLASALNMQYLTDLGPVMGAALDRRPLNRLIVEGGVMRQLQQRGYEFIVVGSDASITSQHGDADRCLCALPAGPTELEHALLGITPLRGPRIARAAMAAHGREVLDAFSQLETVRSQRPMFVLAHVVSPHPPFVLAADGTARVGQSRFTYFDGDGFPGTRSEYLTGYREQSTFVLWRVVKLVERIIARSPSAIIVVHSDHGSGLGLVNTDVTRTDAGERLAIFSAYYSGGRAADVPDDISPVNALRWALRTGLGAELPLLPNRSYLSDYERPYQWHEVPPQAVASR
jgi:hypothetical protein